MGSENQLFVFFACMLSGVLSGLLYEINGLVRFCVRKKTAAIIADVVFFIVFACIYVGVSVVFRLPDYRLYMFLGQILGFLLYLESFHRIVAFLAKRLYTISRSGCSKIRLRPGKTHERRKI